MATEDTAATPEHRVQVDLVSSTPREVLVVVSNPAASTLGWPMGFWGAELTRL
ncbi:hypothetical protein ACIRP7_22055 [Streptomyces sp. NPDC102270]|uniref:hypothetical protein n=1 Tax=Streptomyces sp. NPDC102270 TaxID=3366150 RepID=UPI00382A2CE3